MASPDRPLSRASVLTIADAVRELPMRDCDARRLVLSSGAVRDIEGRKLVLWGLVLDAYFGSERANDGADGYDGTVQRPRARRRKLRFLTEE